MTLELVDYSRTNDADWDRLALALKAAGKVGVGRYAVNDKAPNGRGISADEYAAYVRHGIDVFLYWESTEGWMLNGFAAGVVAAVNAQNNITAAGMPQNTPVYFACDVDAAPEDQAAIDDTLRGCASVLGLDRTGIYGGYYIVKRCKENGTASWFCQTSAWSGGQVFEGAHLYQYSYDYFIDYTNMDLVQAYETNYGQAGFVAPVPVPVPQPKPETVYPKAELPDWWADALKQSHPSDADVEGVRWHAIRRRVEAIGNTYRYTRPDIKSPKSGPAIGTRQHINIERWFVDAHKIGWLVTDTGDFVREQRFTPRIQIRPR